jgi:hypothetical protein
LSILLRDQVIYFVFFSGVDGFYVACPVVFSVNLDCTVGADDSAVGAAGAVVARGLSREVALAVGFFGDADYVIGAYGKTKGATLATFAIDYDFTSHLRIRLLEHYTERSEGCKDQ